MNVKETAIKAVKHNVHLYRAAVKVDALKNQALQASRLARVLAKPLNHKSERKIYPLSIREYCSQQNIIRHILEPERCCIEYEAPYFEKSDGKTTRTLEPDIYWVRLNNVVALGMYDAVIADNLFLNDRFDLPYSSKINFCSESLILDNGGGGIDFMQKKENQSKRESYYAARQATIIITGALMYFQKWPILICALN